MTKQRSNRGITTKEQRHNGRDGDNTGVDIIESEWRARNARKQRSLGPVNYLGGPTAHLPSRIRRVRDPQASEMDVAATAAQF